MGSIGELPVGLPLESVAVVIRLGESGVRVWEGCLPEVQRLDDLFLVELAGTACIYARRPIFVLAWELLARSELLRTP